MSSRRSIYCFFAAAAVLSLLLSYAACRAFLPFRPKIREWKMSGSWVTTAREPGYVGYFRKSFYLSAEVRNAWIAVSACDSYEVIVNGQQVGIQKLWPPNLTFQNATSEKGQRLNNFIGIPNVNYPREYQWETYANYEIPIFFDLTRFSKRGHNCVCIRVNSRKAPVRLCVQGEVLLTTGSVLSLNSDPDWKTASIPRQDVALSWTDEQYNDCAWPAAVAAPRPGPTYRSFAPEIFSEPFCGKWIVPGLASSARAIWFFGHWNINGSPDEAWVRLAANRQYCLFINGQKAEPPTLQPNELGEGDWIAHSRDPGEEHWRPDPMDPDDAGSLFNTESRPSDIESGRGETVTPVPLLHDQEVGTFDAYSVGAMLKEGENEVAVMLIQPGSLLKWAPTLALDGTAISTKGRSTVHTSGADWAAESRCVEGQAKSLGVLERSNAITGLGLAPTMRYLGYCYPNRRKFWEWTFLGGAISLIFLCLVFVLASRHVALFECALGRREIDAAEKRYLAAGTIILAFSGAVLACTMIADASFAGRDEALFFMTGRLWLFALAASAAVALLAGLLFKTSPQTVLRLPAMARTHGFKALLSAILILCAVLRIYDIQFQSSDPDEWASLESILSIARKGVPMLAEDVFYTRSPLYHYLVGGLVAIFGENVWVFRLPSVLFAVGTTSLIYLSGKRLLRSRWTGIAAATLFCLHPLLIDSAHQVRFYSQQEFFILLTIYGFWRGFVEEQEGMKWRYLTLAAFFAAVITHEISVIVGLVLVASYLLFAKRKSWRDEMQFIVAVACVLVFVVLDFVLFQTVCLTARDGVSPEIEPALKFNLMFPSKLYWFFILPSGLHFGSTVFLFLGLPFALRDRNKAATMLCITLFGGVVLTTILITGSGLRYQYWLLPLYFLLLAHGVNKFVEWVVKPAHFWYPNGEPPLRVALAAILMAGVLVTWSPWKIPGSYSTKILPDVDGALDFVRQNMLPRDALAVSAPYTHAAIVDVGRVNYDIEVPVLYDFVYRKNGRLVDRNAGAEVISRLDELQEAVARHERLWVVLTRVFHFRSPAETISWQEPGARFDLFVRTNCELKYQTYLADVFLWDCSKGRLKNFQRAW